jgi:hypothetical protein
MLISSDRLLGDLPYEIERANKTQNCKPKYKISHKTALTQDSMVSSTICRYYDLSYQLVC